MASYLGVASMAINERYDGDDMFLLDHVEGFGTVDEDTVQYIEDSL